MSLPNNLKPKKNYLLSRIGKDNDGGYLVGKKNKTDNINLISLGISNDWSFEDHFLKLYPNTKIVIVGAGFRQAKVVFEYMETIWRNAPILRDL